MLDFEVGSNKIKLSNQNGDLRFREMVWVWIPPIWRAVLSLFYPPVIVRGKNGKNSENPVGSNKSEKRKPKSAVYRSFWASVVYFHLRLISTKSHKGEMTRNPSGCFAGCLHITRGNVNFDVLTGFKACLNDAFSNNILTATVPSFKADLWYTNRKFAMKIYLEMYRSGRNENDSKSFCP